MPTSRNNLSVEISAPPNRVYSVLADLPGFARWLPRSSAYDGTFEVTDNPCVTGTRDTENTPLGRVQGEVEEAVEDRRLVFRQTTERGDFSIRSTYELSAAPGATRVDRTGEVTCSGRLTLLHPIIVASTRRENRRTLKFLKMHLDDGLPVA